MKNSIKKIFDVYRIFIFYIIKIVENIEYNNHFDIDENIISDNNERTQISLLNKDNCNKTIRNICINRINSMKSQLRSYSVKLAEDFIYLMCGFTDDIMMSSAFIQNWQNYLLEYELFGTSISGETIIKKINKQISKEDKIETYDLVEVYYEVMCCNYSGMYRDAEDKKKELKNKIYNMLLDLKYIFDVDKLSHLDICTSKSCIRGNKFIKPYNYKLIYVSFVICIFCISIATMFVIVFNFSYYQNKLQILSNE